MTDVARTTLLACLDHAARPGVGKSPVERRRDGRIGVRFLDRRERATYLSYAELRERAQRVATGLRGAGLSPGQRVALVLPTSPHFYDAFFGALYAGGVPVPLYPPVRLGRLDEYHARTATMLGSVDAKMIVTDKRIRRILGPTVQAARPPLGCRSVAELSASEIDNAALRPAAQDDLAFIQFSSGTTQAPKPIRLTHRHVLENASRILDALLALCPEGETGWVNAGVSWLPLYHDMGLVGCVVVALARPGELTLIPPELFIARPAVWLRTLSRYRGTISPAPNFAYALCAERIKDEELAGVDLSCWRMALNGAEPVTPQVLERFIERFSRWKLPDSALTPVYGLAEATLAVTFSSLGERFRWRRFDREALLSSGKATALDSQDTAGQPLVCLGPPLPGFALRIVDDAGVTLPEDIVGRVWVRGPSLMQGYHERPRETAAVLRDGWLDTGDRGFLHDGELYLYGRAKDIIILRGKNHAPQDIEQALDGLAGLRAGCVAAIGVPPERARAGEELASEALIVLAERRDVDDRPDTDRPDTDRPGTDRPDTDEALARTASRRISEQTGLVPSRVVVLTPGTLPRTSSGKIRRGETRRRYLEGELAPPKPVTPLRMAGELLRSAVAHGRARLRR